MASFSSSVAVDATADEALAYVTDEEHLRSFVSAVEPDETFDPGEGGAWCHPGAVFRHRIDWHGSHSHGWVWVIHRGDTSDLVAEVHTTVDRDGLDARLDAALFALQEGIEQLQVTSSAVPRPEASGSFVVEEVLCGLLRHLPADRRRQLDTYLTRAPSLDGSPALEAKRGETCRAWAEEVAEAGHSELGRRVISFVHHVHRAAAATDEKLIAAEGRTARQTEDADERRGRRLLAPASIAAIDPGAVPDGFRRELDESDDAVAEAVQAAAQLGWDAVPWAKLLDDLFAA